MRPRLTHLIGTPLAFLALLALAPTDASAQVTGKIYGLVIDEEGNPLQGVEIHVMDARTKATPRPGESRKNGKFLFMLEPGNYIMWPIQEGYMTARQVVTSTDPAGRTNVSTYFYDNKQVFDKPIHVYPSGDLTSRTHLEVEFLMAPVDKHVKVVNRLYAEFRGEDPNAIVDEEAAAAEVVEERSAFDRALDFLAQKNYMGAMPLLQQATEEEPENAEAFYQLGKAALEAGIHDVAEEPFKRAAELDPTKPGIHFHLARVYDEKGRKAEAIQELEKELELSPDSVPVKENIARLYIGAGQKEQAIAAYERLIAENPEHYDAYMAVASLHKESGDRAKEEEVYKRMGDKDPTGQSFYNLGNLAFNRSDMDKAKFYYLRVLEKNSKHAMAHYQLGYTLLNTGDIAGAVEHFESFVKLKPKDPKAEEAKVTASELKKLLG